MSASELLREAVLWVTAAAGLASATGWLLRRAPSALRHTLWRFSLVLWWLVPAAVLAGHALPTGMLPAPPAPAYEAPAPAPVSRAAAEAPVPRAPAAPEPSAAAPAAPVVEAAPEATPASEARPARGRSWEGPVLPVGTVLLLLWAIGAGAALARCGRGLCTLRQVRRAARPMVGAALESQVAKWAQRIGLRTPPRLMTCPAVAVPGVIGWRRPWLVLPPGFEAGDPGSAAVLIHELAHIRGGHPRLQLAARVTHAVWWWHPLAWVAARQVQVTAEEVCDDWVVVLTGQPEEYARQLVRWAELGQFEGAVAYAHRGRLLVRRVRRVLSLTGAPQVRVSGRARLALAVGVIALLAAAIVLRAAPARRAASTAPGRAAPPASGQEGEMVRVTLEARTTSAAQEKELERVLLARMKVTVQSGTTVRRQGSRLVVEFRRRAGPSDEYLRALLTTPGRLEFRTVPSRYASHAHPPKWEPGAGGGAWAFQDANGRAVSTARVLAESQVLATSKDVGPESEPRYVAFEAVPVEFTPAASQKMKAFTGSHIGSYLAITLDGKLVSCSLIREPSPGWMAIEADHFTAEGVAWGLRLGVMVRSGPLPVAVRWVSMEPAPPPPPVLPTGGVPAVMSPGLLFVGYDRQARRHVITRVIITPQGLVVKETPGPDLRPLTLVGGRLYGLSLDSRLLAVDLDTNTVVQIGPEALDHPAFGQSGAGAFGAPRGAVYWTKGREIRGYDPGLRAWRKVAAIPDIPGSPAGVGLRVSPGGDTLAYFVRAFGPGDLWQLFVINTSDGQMRRFGQPGECASAIPDMEWAPYGQLLYLGTIAGLPAARYIIREAEMRGPEAYVLEVAMLPAEPGRDSVSFERVPGWTSSPLIWVHHKEGRTTRVSAFSLVSPTGALNPKLTPSELVAGQFRLTVTGPHSASRLSYRDGVLAQARPGQTLWPALSAGQEYVVWTTQESGGKYRLHCFESRSGKRYEATVRTGMQEAVWFSEGDLRPLAGPPLQVGWQRFAEMPYRGE